MIKLLAPWIVVAFTVSLAIGDDQTPTVELDELTSEQFGELIRDAMREPTFEEIRNSLTLREIPEIDLAEQTPIDAATADRVRDLIADLADVERSGERVVIYGSGFLPLDGDKEDWGGRLEDLHMEWSPTLRKLVEIGPDALPFLLEALSDETLTRIHLVHDRSLGGMWHSMGMWTRPHDASINPFSPFEAELVVAPPMRDRPDGPDFLPRYTLTISDLCYVAIGQIVNRDYVVLSYQRTACTVITSPTHNPEIADKVRQIWSADDPRQMLFESLLRDYCTECSSPEALHEAQRLSASLQSGAVRRLLYYFPEESLPLIVERLNQIDSEGSAQNEQDAASTFSTVTDEDFVASVVWSSRPEIREALTELFQRTDNAGILFAAAGSVNDPEGTIIPGRFQPMLDELQHGYDGANSNAPNILEAWIESAPASAEGAMQRYIENGDMLRMQTAFSVLERSSPDWKPRFLRALLDDSRSLLNGTWRRVDAASVDIRVCDKAAEILAREDDTLSFQLEGTVEEVDRQIKAMREELDRRSTPE